MTLLIDISNPEWLRNEDLRDALQLLLPEVNIRCAPDIGDTADIEMLVCDRLALGLVRTLPNLQLVQKTGAGVESIVRDSDLAPSVRVTRLKPDGPAQEIAEYCVAYVLQRQRNFDFHEYHQARQAWMPREPRESPKTTVGVLGLGHIGGRTAQYFHGLEFRVIGWSRSQKHLPGIECHHGRAALRSVLAQCDYVAAILPSTPETRDLFDTGVFAAMRPGAILINAGRGDLIVEQDLIAALDSGHLGGAVLDVFKEEPLPREHPFWLHPKLKLTPHVSGWHLGDGFHDIAENYRRLKNGQPLLHEVDRVAGY